MFETITTNVGNTKNLAVGTPLFSTQRKSPPNLIPICLSYSLVLHISIRSLQQLIATYSFLQTDMHGELNSTHAPLELGVAGKPNVINILKKFTESLFFYRVSVEAHERTKNSVLLMSKHSEN